MNCFDVTNAPLEGLNLVEASAGTGKTYNITRTVLRFLLKKRFGISSILVVTFTDAAASELKYKIRTTLQDALYILEKKDSLPDESILKIVNEIDRDEAIKLLKSALADYDSASVFTIHGFCRKVLFENPFYSGIDFEMELNGNSTPWIKEKITAYWNSKIFNMPPYLAKIFIETDFTVDKLLKLFFTISSRPELEIIHPKIIKDPIKDFESCFNECRDIFLKDEKNICKILTNQDSLNRASYKPANIVLWLEDVKLFFENELTRDSGSLKNHHLIFKFAYNEMVSRLNKNKEPLEHPFFNKLDTLQTLFGNLLSEVINAKLEFIKFIREKLPKQKIAEGVLFYDDLIEKTYNGVLKNSAFITAAAGDYRAVLIDEFQDTDSYQYEIFNQMFIKRNIPFYMIGDPKQAIYGFRGGDIFAYMDASKKAELKSTLGVNYRSDKSLVKCVNDLFLNVKTPFGYDDIKFVPSTVPDKKGDSFFSNGKTAASFQIMLVESTKENSEKTKSKDGQKAPRINSTGVNIVEYVATDIVNLLNRDNKIDNEKITPKDVACLVRTNQDARDMQVALNIRGVNSVIYGGGSVFTSVAAGDMFQILQAINNPFDTGVLKGALTTWGFYNNNNTDDYLESLIQNEREFLYYFEELFENLNTVLGNRGFAFMFETLLEIEIDGHCFVSRVLKSKAGKRYLTDFMHIFELLQKQSMAGAGIFELLNFLSRAIGDPDDFSGEEFEKRMDSDSEAVKIMTVHKSKGLQFNVVYLPFVFKENNSPSQKDIVLFHDVDDNYKAKLDLNNSFKTSLSQFEIESQNESMRLLYVALTRAKHLLKVIWGRFKTFDSCSFGNLVHRFKDDGIKALNWDDNRLIESLGAFKTKTGNKFDFYILHPSSDKYISPVKDFDYVKNRVFKGNIERKNTAMSFSSLVSSHHRDFIFGTESVEGIKLDEIKWKNFDSGPVFGNFIHLVMESINFKTAQIKDIKKNAEVLAESAGYSVSVDYDEIARWIYEILHITIDGKNLKLSAIDNKNRFSELKFTLLVDEKNNFSKQELSKVFSIESDPFIKSYAAKLGDLDFERFKGFLKGYIDLLFMYEGKWYIIDYKTNNLGNISDAYTANSLNDDMAGHDYFLQYHLYTTVAHIYLKRWMKNYNYIDDFGGVFYLYMRGMQYNRSEGIFFDKPPFLRIDTLAELFCKAGV
ncbi:MAG: exodeoxyribonuclease V subunit beta [Deltaproteobacteria bacterium]|nr:exodeoxyribonuclease V subunit beta [Deltaproteobacteria bacterium]